MTIGKNMCKTALNYFCTPEAKALFDELIITVHEATIAITLKFFIG